MMAEVVANLPYYLTAAMKAVDEIAQLNFRIEPLCNGYLVCKKHYPKASISSPLILSH